MTKVAGEEVCEGGIILAISLEETAESLEIPKPNGSACGQCVFWRHPEMLIVKCPSVE